MEEKERRVIGEIAAKYAPVPGAKRKRLMNAWKYRDPLKGEVEGLGRTLLGSFSLRGGTKRVGGGGRKPGKPRSKAVLVYRGPLQGWNEASLSREASRALDTGPAQRGFSGEEMTNNACESLFSVVDVGVEKHRFMFLSRAFRL